MGSCVSSVHKKAEKFVISSPIKENDSSNANPPVLDLGLKYQLSPPGFHNFGSKEEKFFDSHPWLESDCDDDFFSVNGDFTPSRGNTPVHQIISSGNHQVNKTACEDKMPQWRPELSPTSKKKKLSELFSESISESIRDGEGVKDQDVPSPQNLGKEQIEVNPHIHIFSPTSKNNEIFLSGPNSLCSSGRTSNADVNLENEKPLESAQCCLPRFISSHSSSFDERNILTSTSSSVR